MLINLPHWQSIFCSAPFYIVRKTELLTITIQYQADVMRIKININYEVRAFEKCQDEIYLKPPPPQLIYSQFSVVPPLYSLGDN